MDDKVRILLLEDQSFDAELAEHEIKKSVTSYHLKWVDNRDDFIHALSDFVPDIVISDYNLPTITGLEALKLKQSIKPDVPLIIFTGSLNEDIAVGCMKAGAVDYVIKEHMKRLGPAVVSALEQNEIVISKKKAELELIKSEERFHRLADNLPDIIYRYQLIPEQKIEYINPAIERITGYTPQEHYNDPSLFKSLIYPEDEHLLDIKAYSKTDFLKPLIIRWKKKDGNVIWLEQRNIPVYDIDGNIIAIEGIAHDITEKRKDEILKQAIYTIASATNSTQNLDELYTEVHVTILNIMPAKNFYIALYHSETNEISFPYFVDEKDLPPTKRPFRHGLTEYVITTGRSILCNLECTQKLINDGEIDLVGELAAIWLGVPLKFEDETIGVLVVQHYNDETAYSEREQSMLEYISTQVAKTIEYKKAELQIQENSEQIKVQNIELQDLINELNRNNSELIKAKERAEESDKLKTAFIQNMSHEIRTPMNAIMGFSELMEFEIDDKEKLLYCTKVIKQRSNDLLDIINELLDIARIESGQMELKIEPVELNEFINELHNFYLEQNEVIENSNIDIIRKEVPQYINSVLETDYGKLKQIFVNIINNAIKFTNEGRIEFGFHSVTSENITFYVSDTGKGISEKTKEIIFDRFRKSADESVYVKDGLGLGLAIVKGLLMIFNGKIWVESELGTGSTFYFSVPYKPLKTQIVTKESKANISYDWSNYKVLIVEDDSFNVSLFIELLHDTKIKCLVANTGQNAISTFNAQKDISIVLMDIKLPDINGYEVTAEFKKINPNIPIIAQTAYASDADRKRAFKVGCDDFIPKPIKRDKLLAIFNVFLSS